MSLTSNPGIEILNWVVRFIDYCIVVSTAIAGRRWSEAEPEAGNGSEAASGTGGQ